METFHGIGLMSGTSLDGLDIAYCIFIFKNGTWSFTIEKAETVKYPPEIKNKLSVLHKASKNEIDKMDKELGRVFADATNSFIQRHKLSIDFIASHGHTVLHQPDRGVTLQIGKGEEIAKATGIIVINDFRSKDVAMGGQGAPLVPVGDRLLFHEYDYCLNIGGIANISYEANGIRLAFDVCPANMVLNKLAERAGKPFDEGGKLAAEGSIIPDLLADLESLPYYRERGPRSLGKEWVEEHIFPIMEQYYKEGTTRLLNTFCEHMALRISDVVTSGGGRMLVSGGGAYNKHLIERIAQLSKMDVVVPGPEIIEYKEALIFAFLGVLRLKGINNVLASVTGAPEDHCSGRIISVDS